MIWLSHTHTHTQMRMLNYYGAAHFPPAQALFASRTQRCSFQVGFAWLSTTTPRRLGSGIARGHGYSEDLTKC